MSQKTAGHLVIAFFETIEGADYAAFELQEWGKINLDAGLSAVDVMSQNAKGKIETRSLGPAHAGKGAKIGVAAGLIAGVLSGGITLVGGALAGAALGGVAGVFSKKRAVMTDQEKEAIAARLAAGNVAVLAMCNPAAAEVVIGQLQQLGGQVQDFAVAEDAGPAEAPEEGSPPDPGPAS